MTLRHIAKHVQPGLRLRLRDELRAETPFSSAPFSCASLIAVTRATGSTPAVIASHKRRSFVSASASRFFVVSVVGPTIRPFVKEPRPQGADCSVTVSHLLSATSQDAQKPLATLHGNAGSQNVKRDEDRQPDLMYVTSTISRATLPTLFPTFARPIAMRRQGVTATHLMTVVARQQHLNGLLAGQSWRTAPLPAWKATLSDHRNDHAVQLGEGQALDVCLAGKSPLGH